MRRNRRNIHKKEMRGRRERLIQKTSRETLRKCTRPPESPTAKKECLTLEEKKGWLGGGGKFPRVKSNDASPRRNMKGMQRREAGALGVSEEW